MKLWQKSQIKGCDPHHHHHHEEGEEHHHGHGKSVDKSINQTDLKTVRSQSVSNHKVYALTQKKDMQLVPDLLEKGYLIDNNLNQSV